MLVGDTCCPVPALEADQRPHPKKAIAPGYAGACGRQMYQRCHDGHPSQPQTPGVLCEMHICRGVNHNEP